MNVIGAVRRLLQDYVSRFLCGDILEDNVLVALPWGENGAGQRKRRDLNFAQGKIPLGR